MLILFAVLTLAGWISTVLFLQPWHGKLHHSVVLFRNVSRVSEVFLLPPVRDRYAIVLSCEYRNISRFLLRRFQAMVTRLFGNLVRKCPLIILPYRVCEIKFEEQRGVSKLNFSLSSFRFFFFREIRFARRLEMIIQISHFQIDAFYHCVKKFERQ